MAFCLDLVAVRTPLTVDVCPLVIAVSRSWLKSLAALVQSSLVEYLVRLWS